MCSLIYRKYTIKDSPPSLPVKYEGFWSKIGCYRRVDPFAIFFIYPKDKKPFVIKGGYQDLLKIVDTYKYWHLRCETLWHKRHSRVFWGTNVPHISIYFTKKIRRHLIYYKSVSHEPILSLRRMPRKWIKELNNYIP